jgi:multidrug efflux pump subunit AcrA (membrane-fusion protein)
MTQHEPASPSPGPATTPAPGSWSPGLADPARDLRAASASEFLPDVRPWVQLAGAVLLGGFLAGVGLLAVWPYRVIVRASGSARPSGETSLVHAPREGRVSEIRIRTNQTVSKGEVLAVLDPADLQAREQKLNQVRTALERQLDTQRQEDQATFKASELQARQARATLQRAQSEFQRYSKLVESGAASRDQVDEKAANLDIARSGFARAEQEVDQQRFRGDSAQARLHQQLAETRAEQAQLGLDLGRTLVRAPVGGVVFSVALRNPMQVVSAGQELARIAPQGAEMLVKVLVRSEDIARVEPGQMADLRLVGCPYPDFGTLPARVFSVAPDALAAEAAPGGGSAATAGSSGYEVTLRPVSTELLSHARRSCALRQGMDLTADISTREETVLQFLLRRSRLWVGW